MNALSEEFETGMDAEAETGGTSVEPTYWGYVLRAEHRRLRADMLLEKAGRFLGVILLMSAGGLWIMPDALYGAELIAMKIAATVAFAILGAVLFWSVRDGLSEEAQVDLMRSEIRMGQRNANGDFRMRSMIPFGDVGSVFLQRSERAGERTRLYLRYRDSDMAYELAAGRTGQLEGIKERLARDLKGRSVSPGARGAAA